MSELPASPTTTDTAQAALDEVYDRATGLPGPRLFFDRVQQAMLLARREELTAALVVVHIQATGHARTRPPRDAVRLELIRTLADRISNSLRASDTVGIMQMDAMGILLPNVIPAGVPAVLRRVLVESDRRAAADGTEWTLSVDLGLALQGDHHSDANELIEAAWENLVRRRSTT